MGGDFYGHACIFGVLSLWGFIPRDWSFGCGWLLLVVFLVRQKILDTSYLPWVMKKFKAVYMGMEQGRTDAWSCTGLRRDTNQ